MESRPSPITIAALLLLCTHKSHGWTILTKAIIFVSQIDLVWASVCVCIIDGVFAVQSRTFHQPLVWLSEIGKKIHHICTHTHSLALSQRKKAENGMTSVRSLQFVLCECLLAIVQSSYVCKWIYNICRQPPLASARIGSSLSCSVHRSLSHSLNTHSILDSPKFKRNLRPECATCFTCAAVCSWILC